MSHFKYWGKVSRVEESSSPSYHLLAYHSLDVAAVTYELLKPKSHLCRSLANFLEIEPKQLQDLFVLIMVMHDLGKFASAFQALKTFENSPLLKANPRSLYDARNYRHDRLGLYFWNKIKQDLSLVTRLFNLPSQEYTGSSLVILEVLMQCALGHHGKPVGKMRDANVVEFVEHYNQSDVFDFIESIIGLLSVDFPVDKLDSKEWIVRLKQASWHLAGLAVLADWLGSDNEYFTYHDTPQADLSSYWLHAKEQAIKIVRDKDILQPVAIKPFKSVREHYGFEPTPLQRWAETVEVQNSQQLFILEDVTGAGKTEAAHCLIHRLMCAGAADGFFFGLPTMATSNAMFERVSKHYLDMMGDEHTIPSIVLAHGAKEMNRSFREAINYNQQPDENYQAGDRSATAQCNQWLSDNNKKSLLASVGVGTIDQALMAILPKRHQSLRLLGIHRKVLVFDEIHAADEYMFELLESLLLLHLYQGGSAVLLTATLPQKRRKRLCEIWQSVTGELIQFPKSNAFPLATRVSIKEPYLIEQPLATRQDVRRTIQVNFLHSVDSCIDRMLEAVSNNQCIVWVRNTVDDAIAAYQTLIEKMSNPEHCILFHSRFIFHDRQAIEKKVMDTFGKEPSCASKRAGRVLICTQVFQESLDADADWMISDICPIDDFIQRIGRCRRHTRDSQGRYQPGIIDSRGQPQVYMHAPAWQDQPNNQWLSKGFSSTQAVYRSAGRLWLGMQKLKALGAIALPEDSREIIESVYSEEAGECIPEALQNLEDEYYADQRVKQGKAKASIIPWQRQGYSGKDNEWGEDSAHISTRFTDLETVEVLLVKIVDNVLKPWVEHELFPLQMSTLKIAKIKFASNLAPVPSQWEAQAERLRNQYKRLSFTQFWAPEYDDNYSYCSRLGFIPADAGND